LNKSQKLIDVFEINSVEEFIDKEPLIKKRCDEKGCRAYLRVNRRSRKKTALEMLRELSCRTANDDYNIRNIYHSVLGKYMSKHETKKWIIDLDGDDVNRMDEMVAFILELYKKANKVEYTRRIYNVPTINGIHLIVHPFNLAEFNKKFKNIDIHKDNPTLLYFNGDENVDSK